MYAHLGGWSVTQCNLMLILYLMSLNYGKAVMADLSELKEIAGPWRRYALYRVAF